MANISNPRVSVITVADEVRQHQHVAFISFTITAHRCASGSGKTLGHLVAEIPDKNPGIHSMEAQNLKIHS